MIARNTRMTKGSGDYSCKQRCVCQPRLWSNATCDHAMPRISCFPVSFWLHSPACWGNAAEQAGPGPRRERRLKAGNDYWSRPWNLMLIIPSVWERVCVPSHPRVEDLPGLNLIRALPLVVVPSGNISIWTTYRLALKSLCYLNQPQTYKAHSTALTWGQ